jgi:hypothetical protein
MLFLCLIKHHDMKAYSRIVAVDRGKWLASSTRRLGPPPIPAQWYALDRNLGKTHSRSGSCGEQKNPGSLPPISRLSRTCLSHCT